VRGIIGTAETPSTLQNGESESVIITFTRAVTDDRTEG
jgi:hypothetical protein